MRLSADALRAAFTEIPPGGSDPIADGWALAAKLCTFIEASQAGSEIVEVHAWAFNVEFVLRNGDHWAIECLSLDDFRMYPGFVRGDTVTWPNIWVRPTNMSLDELVNDINNVAFCTTKDEFENA